MDLCPNKQPYLAIEELASSTGLSTATLWRLKRAGKIPFCQPGGKGSRVLFPKDAIEQISQNKSLPAAQDYGESSPKHLPGPQPEWMSQQTRNR